MYINQENIIVSDVRIACRVFPGMGTMVHKDRPSDGFVINDGKSVKYYYFSDGTVLKTHENEFFYLPKRSSYEVKEIKPGGCYAINFDSDIVSEPFCLKFRNYEKVLKIFKESEKQWRENTPYYQMTLKKSVYELILMVLNEQNKNYLPEKKSRIIMPALEKIKTDFNSGDLSVAELASLCNVSEVYFRKIFVDKFGVSPKEYIINMRINYAKELLESGMFSVAEVASFAGYTEQCHFSREFKKRIGENPRSFK